MSEIIVILLQALSFYSLLLIGRILLTWFPNVDWSNPFFRTLSQVTDPYLNIFRSVIPPFGGLDFSPMVAIILLQVVQRSLAKALVGMSVLY